MTSGKVSFWVNKQDYDYQVTRLVLCHSPTDSKGDNRLQRRRRQKRSSNKVLGYSSIHATHNQPSKINSNCTYQLYDVCYLQNPILLHYRHYSHNSFRVSCVTSLRRIYEIQKVRSIQESAGSSIN